MNKIKLSEAIKRLLECGIENARGEAIAIFTDIGGFTKEELYADDQETNSKAVIDAIERRADGEPLQYILGYTYFYRERYTVTPNCLIPRFDTEILVDYAVKSLPNNSRFLDLCTGSGCVAISTLKNTHNTRAIAVDISEAALEIAMKNAEDNSVSDRIEFAKSNVLEEVVAGKFYAILSNPPYIEENVYPTLDEEVKREPKIALVGGTDGLDFYRAIIKNYKNSLLPGGFFGFEIGYNQGKSLSEISKAEDMDCRIIKDFSGNDRVAVLLRR